MNSFPTLSSEIETFYKQTRPFARHIEEKQKLFLYIEQCVKYLHKKCLKQAANIKKMKNLNSAQYKFLENMTSLKTSNKEWNIFKFGSESWGTCCGNSDIDVAISINFRNNRSDKKFLLKKLSKIISENDKNGSLRIQLLLNAKYPIIRIYHIYFKYIKYDLSIADRYCLKRNNYIHNLIKIYSDIQIKKLIIFIKYWSKQRCINNSYKCYLNSFGFTLLIIKFIKYYTNQPQSLPTDLTNLVYKFFEFYVVKYDETKHSISINNNYKYKHIFNTKYDNSCIMEIIDPLDPHNNVTKNVGYIQYNRIRLEFMRSYQICKDFLNGKQSMYPTMSLFNELTREYTAYYISDDISITGSTSTSDDIVTVSAISSDHGSDDGKNNDNDNDPITINESDANAANI